MATITTATAVDAQPPTPADDAPDPFGCTTITCALKCEGECGWSRGLGRCMHGLETEASEIKDRLGDCPPPSTTPVSVVGTKVVTTATATATRTVTAAAESDDAGDNTAVVVAVAIGVVLVCVGTILAARYEAKGGVVTAR